VSAERRRVATFFVVVTIGLIVVLGLHPVSTTRIVAGYALALAAIGVAQGALSINGAGATFPYPMYSKWFDAYHQKFPNLAFNYQSIGSGGGIAQIKAGTVDFGATDQPLASGKRRHRQGAPISRLLAPGRRRRSSSQWRKYSATSGEF